MCRLVRAGLVPRRSLLTVALMAMLSSGCNNLSRQSCETPRDEHPPARRESAIDVETPTDKALLPLEDGPPLLLDDDGGAEDSSREGTDNSRCHVCHLNYADEIIAVRHARAGMGCAHCHGESDAHIADESWATGDNGTAPDVMFTREQVNPFCMRCHTKEKIDLEPHTAILKGEDKRCCTDCHGEHRLDVRKCKWK